MRPARSRYSRIGMAFSETIGPMTTRQPSSTSVRVASIADLTEPRGRPSPLRWTTSIGRSSRPDDSASSKTIWIESKKSRSKSHSSGAGGNTKSNRTPTLIGCWAAAIDIVRSFLATV